MLQKLFLRRKLALKTPTQLELTENYIFRDEISSSVPDFACVGQTGISRLRTGIVTKQNTALNALLYLNIFLKKVCDCAFSFSSRIMQLL